MLPFQFKTVLITGGAGFIGSNLAKALLEEKARIICLDNFISSHKDNIEDLRSNQNFEFIFHDVIYPFKTTETIDYIYHLACPASPPVYQKNPIETSKINFLGTLNMLELAREKNAAFLYTSTSEVYGDPLEHPQKESYRGNVNTVGPRACYDEGKRVGETLCYDYFHKHQVKVKIARLFNTYGPKMNPNDGRVISNFVNQAIEGIPLTIYGTGQQTRSFCYIDDMLQGLIKLMAKDIDSVMPINLGNPIEHNILEIAHIILSYFNLPKSHIQFKNLPIDDPQKRRPNIELAKKVLNWAPSISIEEGIVHSIKYYESLLSK